MSLRIKKVFKAQSLFFCFLIIFLLIPQAISAACPLCESSFGVDKMLETIDKYNQQMQDMQDQLELRKEDREQEWQVRLDEMKEKSEQRMEEVRQKTINRFARVYQGTITSLGDNSLRVKQFNNTYTVNIMPNTKLLGRFGETSELSDFKIGNIVSVFGEWMDEEKTTIRARIIKNLSVKKRWGAFFGEVISNDESLIIIETISRGDQQVYISINTVIISQNGETSSITKVQVGDKIRIKGTWDAYGNYINNIEEIKDFSM